MSYFAIDYKNDAPQFGVSRKLFLCETEDQAIDCLHAVVKEQGRKVVQIYKVFKIG